LVIIYPLRHRTLPRCHHQKDKKMEKMRTYILYGAGIVLCIAGIAYLAAEYVKFLSEPGKLACLIIMVGMFALFGKHLEERGW
jgi:uncharacterized membrane protein